MLLSMVAPIAALAMLAAAPGVKPDAYVAEVEAWRAAREARLRGEEGWLSVAGLFWLKEGANRMGSGTGVEIALPKHAVPGRAGTLTLERGKVAFTIDPAVKATLGGKAVTSGVLRSDVPGPPDVLAIGPLRLFVIERTGRLAIRLRDLDTPARRTFAGLRWFPVRPEYRIEARFVPHPSPKKIAVPTILGVPEEMPSPGTAIFTFAGRELRLDAVLETPEAKELFFIFRDATAGKETYGAGRFFYASMPRDGKVVVDFNRAYTPPCAFTAFATCPLPPPQNRLKVRIEAGEKDPGRH